MMITKEAIEAALSTHAQWRNRIQNAIETGTSEFKPNIVKTDNNCEFGKWLYDLSSEDKKSDDYSIVKVLHADFHKVAGEILQLAVSGKKEDAIKKIASGGDYQTATGKLVLALREWKNKLS
jgi:hypothetical protein